MVNFNAGNFLQKAIDKVAAQTNTAYEFILVDNASMDGSIKDLKTDHIPNFQLIELQENIGFAAANNLAAAKAQGAWIALLNPDTEAQPGWLAAFQKATDMFPDTVMFAGATISTTDPDVLDGAGDCYHVLGIPWRGGFGRPSNELPDRGECFSPCGASALIHRDTFLDVGGFDESYFCYCEDVDLGFRLRLEGHNCIFWPDALVSHYGSGTTSVGSAFAVRHGTRNRLWTFLKNMPPLALFLLTPWHILFTLILIGRALIKGGLKPTLMGLLDGIKGIGQVLPARRIVQSRRKLTSWQICKQMSWNIPRMLQRKSDVTPL